MIRKAFVMQVNPGCEREYARRHERLWYELEQTLKSHGVHDYSIFLHPGTRQLFAYAVVESEERWQAIVNEVTFGKADKYERIDTMLDALRKEMRNQ